ncbi:MAG: 4-hydroxy-tetrahydrodipicolinate synthase [Candidatus Bathyarchaeales archaeon]
MLTKKLEGIFVPHVTPFSRDGKLDEEALRTCVRFWLEGGVSGLMPCGSNGEAPYLSREERKMVVEVVLDEVSGSVPVVAGTGSASTWETIQLTKDAKDLGVDAALVVTPFYFKLSSKEIYEHYRAVLEAVDLPLVLYSVPKFTGYSLEPAIISRLASEYDNVVGIKDSGGNMSTIAETIRLVGDKISVLAGTADVALPTLMLGGKGAVIAVANVFPKLCASLYDAFKRGAYEEASRLQKLVTYANDVLVKKYNQLSAIKEALKLLGLPAGYPRKPALPLEEAEKREVENFLKIIEGA